MDLVVDEVGQFQDVDVAHHDLVVVGLSRTTVVEGGLAVDLHEAFAVGGLRVDVLEDLLDCRMLAGAVLFVPVGSVVHRGGNVHRRRCGRTGLALDPGDGLLADGFAVDLPAPPGAVSEVGLEHLANVHAGGNAEGVQDDVDGGAVGKVRKVLDGQDP